MGVGEGTGDGEIRDVVQNKFSGVGIGKFTLDFRYVGIFLRSRMGNSVTILLGFWTPAAGSGERAGESLFFVFDRNPPFLTSVGFMN